MLLHLAGDDPTAEGARLYRSMLDKAILERDLSIAAELQQALLPSPRAGPRRLDKGGPIAGVFNDAVFEQETVELQEGDRVIVFSDGLTEAVNNHGDDFGEDRLLDCLQNHRELNPDDLLNWVFDEVRRFCAPAPQSDDLTALVLRYLG